MAHKYEQVATTLMDRIAAGQYATGMLPREIDLVEELGVSRVTVNRAIQRLAGRGIVRRVKKQGTFIVGQGDETLSLLHQVGVVMQSRGHFYSELCSSLCRHLMRHGLFPVNVDPFAGEDLDAHGCQPVNRDYARAVQRLLGAPIRGIVFDGASYYSRPILAGNEDKRAVCVHCFDAPGDPPPHAAFADYAGGIRLAVKHLVRLGHRDIMLFGVFPFDPLPTDPSHQRNAPLMQMRESYMRTMQEAGLEAHTEVVQFSERPPSGMIGTDDGIRGVLARPNRPTAIVCEMDFLAVKVIMRAMELGLRVPQDLAVTGLFNTPWATESPVSITTIDMDVNTMARRATELMIGTRHQTAPYIVPPRLVVRASCGAAAFADAAATSPSPVTLSSQS